MKVGPVSQLSVMYVVISSLDNYFVLQKAIGDKAAATLESHYGTKYTVGNVAETICKYQMRLLIE